MSLMSLSYVIPSKGRANKQTTLNNLPSNIRKIVSIAVPSTEAKDYRGIDANILSVPSNIKGISKTRKWLIETCQSKYLMMLDDDMTFAYRPSMYNPKLLPVTPIITAQMFSFWEHLAKIYDHVGLSARQGNNRFITNPGESEKEYTICTRMCNAYVYNIKQLHKLTKQKQITIGRLPVMEDFDLTLQLLRLGYPNAVITRYCWNQGGSNLPGGCSTYRTAEVQKEAAHKLKELHPDFVRVVEKKSKSVWKGMEIRTDVVVSWKKAYDSSR